MKRVATIVACALLYLTPHPVQAQGPTPAAQFEALRKEFGEAGYRLHKATTDVERRKAADIVEKLSRRGLELAQKHPQDPIAREVLVQVMQQEIWLLNNSTHPGRGNNDIEAKAVAQLLRDHLASDQLGAATWRLSYGFSQECETFLRTVFEKSPHAQVQGQACLRLAQFLNARLNRLVLLREQPDVRRRYQRIFGNEYLQVLERQDRSAVLKEVERLFEKAIAKYSEVKLPYGHLVGDKAKTELHELRFLSVGKTAPDIESADQDGQRFKLSDYRGKVVLLYFWSEY